MDVVDCDYAVDLVQDDGSQSTGHSAWRYGAVGVSVS